jgi:predicted transcriptional regulator
MDSNYEIVKNTIRTYPGLRFHQIKKETDLANGTLQHHINRLIKSKSITAIYEKTIPRYFEPEIDANSQIMIKRLSQKTPSKIINLLLKKECQTFSQIVSYTKKSPGTVSIYKNMLLKDKILVGDTSGCKDCDENSNSVKYRLVNPKKMRTLVMEYGKTSLKKSADNLADVFLSIK